MIQMECLKNHSARAAVAPCRRAGHDIRHIMLRFHDSFPAIGAMYA